MRDLMMVSNLNLLPHALAFGIYTKTIHELDLCIVNNNKLSQETLASIRSLGAKLVEFPIKSESAYRKIHLLPAYGLHGSLENILSTLRFDTLVAHSDGWRNGLYIPESVSNSISEIVHYVFLLQEEAVDKSLNMKLAERKRIIVPFGQLKKAWDILAGEDGLKLREKPIFSKEDLLICFRHWGQGYYKFRDGITLKNVLHDHICKSIEHKRVIIKLHPWADDSTQMAAVKHLRECNYGLSVQFRLWDELELSTKGNELLYNPEALLFLGGMGDLGASFLFDSSLNITLGLESPKTRIIWPKEDKVSNYFEKESSALIVKQQISWMRELLKVNHSEEKEMKDNLFDLDLPTPGFWLNQAISNGFIRDLNRILGIVAAERESANAQLESANAQLESANAQLESANAQLDKVTRERDQALASLSWRITAPMRMIRKVLSS